jgi:phosphotransferase system enzyme I (PtsI)
MKIIQGVPVSSGIVTGTVYLLNKNELKIPEYYVDDIPFEMDRLKKAISIAQKEINWLAETANKNKFSEECELLEAHSSIMDDPELFNLTLSFIANEHRNAEYCFNKAAEHFASIIESGDNEYMSARAKDVREIAVLILNNLLGIGTALFHELKSPSLIVAKNITVNEIAALDKKLILGFLTESGGITDHAVILARSYGIPFVSGLNGLLSEISNNDELIMDGNKGRIIINPDAAERSKYSEQINKLDDFYSVAFKRRLETAITTDGRKIKVCANISDKTFMNDAIKNGAEGVGLLRTEFLFLAASEMPDEDEQYHIYSLIGDAFEGKEIIIRTLDIGADKQNANFNLTNEANPALGLRGLRLCFQKENELFKPQIKAILRAAYKTNIRLMLPMVTSVQEVKEFKTLLEVCKMELKDKYIRHNNNISIGIMIEVPSAAILADAFADEVDFFSIGTNDLTQYTLAADRTNSAVSYLTQGLHPAVLELIKMTIKAAHKKNKTVAVCGELASDPKAIAVLVGLGADELSVTPASIPVVKEIIRSMEYAKAKIISQKALKTHDKNKMEILTDKLIPKILH